MRASSALSFVMAVTARVGPKASGISSAVTVDDAGEGEEELAIGQRVVGGVAENDRGQQVGRSPRHSTTRPPARWRAVTSTAPGFAEVAVDHGGDPPRHVGVGEGCELRLGIVFGAGTDLREPLGQGLGDLVARGPSPTRRRR